MNWDKTINVRPHLHGSSPNKPPGTTLLILIEINIILLIFLITSFPLSLLPLRLLLLFSILRLLDGHFITRIQLLLLVSRSHFLSLWHRLSFLLRRLLALGLGF